MGTIKDLIDLTTQLTNSVKDRKIASELSAIQSLISTIQAEQGSLHESNISLREENLSYREQIQGLEAEIKELKSSRNNGPKNVPTCPNCSTTSTPFYMSPVAVDFITILDATHECSKCNYKTKIKNPNKSLHI